MPDIQSAISDLNAAVDAASVTATSLDAKGNAAEKHLEAVNRAIDALGALQQRAETLKRSLEQRGVSANKAAEAYFDQIAKVRTALESGGPLTDSVQTSQQTAVVNALAALPTPDNTPIADLLAKVETYDSETTSDVADAKTALETAITDLATAKATHANKAQVFETADQALSQLVALAGQAKEDAVTSVEAVQEAVADGKPYPAVVHLHDLRTLRSRLKNAVSLTAGPPSFDANATDPTALAADIKAAWDTARNEYETAASALFTAEKAVIDAEVGVTKAEAEAAKRNAERTMAAAAPQP